MNFCIRLRPQNIFTAGLNENKISCLNRFKFSCFKCCTIGAEKTNISIRKNLFSQISQTYVKNNKKMFRNVTNVCQKRNVILQKGMSGCVVQPVRL
jgi:hypothetical protein